MTFLGLSIESTKTYKSDSCDTHIIQYVYNSSCIVHHLSFSDGPIFISSIDVIFSDTLTKMGSSLLLVLLGATAISASAIERVTETQVSYGTNKGHKSKDSAYTSTQLYHGQYSGEFRHCP